MPAKREVVTRSPKRSVGLINCPWFQEKPIAHESRLEKHFVLRAMLYPGLKSIEHQPFRMDLAKHGKYYTPDFLLTFSSGEQLVFEVKRSERISPLKERFTEIANFCEQASMPFFVVHQGQIEGQLRAQRASLIRRYAMSVVGRQLEIDVQNYLKRFPNGTQIAVLKKRFQLSDESIYSMLARRRVSASKGLLISDEDKLFFPEYEVKCASIQFGSWFGCSPWATATRIHQSIAGQQDSISRSENEAVLDN